MVALLDAEGREDIEPSDELFLLVRGDFAGFGLVQALDLVFYILCSLRYYLLHRRHVVL